MVYSTYLKFNILDPRSCHDLANFGIRTSGFYLIDPDGFAIGEGPIRVYCNVDSRGHGMLLRKYIALAE